ncbi:MAG TPA: hypothetical protein VNI77_03185 [Nitrososphaera sp.]|nr:hypothetical protein [Nitrososphaera sp.]
MLADKIGQAGKSYLHHRGGKVVRRAMLLALCATVGLRPQCFPKVKWSEIDFENAWVMTSSMPKSDMCQIRCTATLQPCCSLYRGEVTMTGSLPGYKRVANELKAIGTRWRQDNLRDHSYNRAQR